MDTIELFCGIGGFRLGVEPLGFRTVFANDINKKSLAVYRSNFGDKGVVEEDINQISLDEIPPHDLLTAGFPCQPFSPAGKKKGINDATNGTLFRRIVDIVAYHQPNYFILENVRRMLSMQNGEHFNIILSELTSLNYTIEWRVINSISFGIPQHRQRVFLIGKKCDSKPDTLMPDLLMDDNSDLFHSDNFSADRMSLLSKTKEKFGFWGMAYDGGFIDRNVTDDLNVKKKKYLKDILQDESSVDIKYIYTENTKERILNSVFVDRYYNGVKILYNQGGGARLGYTIFGTDGYSSTLTASTSRHYERYQVGDVYRRLTNIEYARLMGFPDNWCRDLSPYDQHFSLGNSVIPACVNWVAEKLVGNINLKLEVA